MMNPNEIKKTLECCIRNDGCEQCPISEKCFFFYNKPYVETPEILRLSLDLINQLEAEVEKYQATFEPMVNLMVEAKAEAIKEFAEKMKGVIPEIDDTYIERIVEDYIDNLVKEMGG